MKTKIINIASDISRLSREEIGELTSQLFTEHNISATMYHFGVSSSTSHLPYETGSPEYNVVMTRCGDRKLMVVKTIKELLGIGLREAKHLADEVPIPIKENCSYSESEELRIALEAAGARIVIQEV